MNGYRIHRRSWNLPNREVWKAVVRSHAVMGFVLLFVGLVVQCAFDDHGAQAATAVPSQGGSALCGTVSAASVKITLPNEPARQAASGEAILPLPDVCPLWTLARSIDHPPELSA